MKWLTFDVIALAQFHVDKNKGAFIFYKSGLPY